MHEGRVRDVFRCIEFARPPTQLRHPKINVHPTPQLWHVLVEYALKTHANELCESHNSLAWTICALINEHSMNCANASTTTLMSQIDTGHITLLIDPNGPSWISRHSLGWIELELFERSSSFVWYVYGCALFFEAYLNAQKNSCRSTAPTNYLDYTQLIEIGYPICKNKTWTLFCRISLRIVSEFLDLGFVKCFVFFTE